MKPVISRNFILSPLVLAAVLSVAGGISVAALPTPSCKEVSQDVAKHIGEEITCIGEALAWVSTTDLDGKKVSDRTHFLGRESDGSLPDSALFYIVAEHTTSPLAKTHKVKGTVTGPVKITITIGGHPREVTAVLLEKVTAEAWESPK